MNYKLILTEFGLEELQKAVSSNAPFDAAFIGVGDSNGRSYEPDKTQTELKNRKCLGEIYEKGIKKLDNNNSYLYFDMQIPADTGGFTIREVGLYDKNFKLLGVAKYPETYKDVASGSSEEILLIELQIYLSDEAINNIVIDNSGTLVTEEKVEKDYQKLIEKACPNGYASLDSDGKVPKEQLPDIGGGLEVGDIGVALYIDETKGKRRVLNGSILAINSNTQGFVNYLKGLQATDANLFTTEENWQAEAALSAFGQCGKFVLDETAGTVHLPKVVNIQGLQDMAQAGMTIPAGLPNIKGEAKYILTVGDEGSEALDFTIESSAILGGVNGGAKESVFSFNASNSNSIYGASDTVQPEAILYPFFIQIATGSETEVNIVNEIELNNPYTLFDIKYSETQLYNSSWLLSNGQWNSGAVYAAVWAALLVEHNEEVEVGTKVTLPSGISYVKRGLNVKLSTDEYTDYDFVLNTEDETFRLPLKTKLASGSAVVGNGLTFGLTNGYQNAGLMAGGSGPINLLEGDVGSYGKPIGSIVEGSPLDWTKSVGVTTDPENSGLETSRQGLYLYFYVGETVQNANLIDAGRLSEQLAEKLGRSNKEEIVSWGMPDYSKRTKITLANTWYPAEQDSEVWWVSLNGKSNQLTISPDKTTLYTFMSVVQATSFAGYTVARVPRGWFFKFISITSESNYPAYIIPLIGG